MTELSFPLFTQLPQKAQRKVLRTMDYGELISFSLCSKLSKLLATSLKYTAHYLYLKVANGCELQIKFRNTELIALLESPSTINFVAPSLWNASVGKYQIADFKGSHWVSHFGSVFNTKHVANLSVGDNQMTVESIQNAMGPMKFDTLGILNVDLDYAEQLVSKLVPRRTIYKVGGSFQSCSKVLQQNLELLTVPQCQNWKLNDILLLNTKCARLYSVTLTSKDMNRFLKLWAKGSNPNLIHFECVAVERILDKDEIKRGIDGVEVPEETTRFLTTGALGAIPLAVEGGFDIRRCDGTIGTLDFQNDTCFHFIVHQ